MTTNSTYQLVNKSENEPQEFFEEEKEVKFSGRNKRKIIILIVVLSIVAIVIIASVVALILALLPRPDKDVYFNSDFRHSNLDLEKTFNSVTSNGTLIYTPNSQVYRMSLVNNQIWIPLPYHQNFAVIDLEGNQVEEKKYDFITNAVIQADEDTLVMATYDGLKTADLTGHITSQLLNGHFIDVSKHEHKMAALDKTAMTVYILIYNNSHWLNHTQFKLINSDKIESPDMMTIILMNDTLFLCSAENKQVYVFDIPTTALVDAYGKNDDRFDGPYVPDRQRLYLSWPRIHAIDRTGSIVVCNKERHRFRFLTRDLKWKSFRPPFLKYNYMYPSDFVIVKNYLFMAFRSGSLVEIKRYNIPGDD